MCARAVLLALASCSAVAASLPAQVAAQRPNASLVRIPLAREEGSLTPYTFQTAYPLVTLVVAYLTAAADQGPVNILIASVVIGLGYCCLHSTLQTWATEVAPEARGTATSLFVTAVFAGAAIGTAAVSGLADEERYDVVFLLAAALTVPVAVVGAVARATLRCLTMTIPEIAFQGYALGGDDYERARPTYPAEAVQLLVGELGIGPGRTVLDLGAGTGKLTRLLCPTGATLVAVEPVQAMRRHLVASVQDVQVLEGTAEAIALADASVHSVVVGTAFHWFRGEQALAEIVRVLKPDGGLGLVWNNVDSDVDWVAEIWDLVGTKRRSAPRNRDLSWKEAFASAGQLTPLRHRRFPHSQQLGIDGLIARVHSIAFVASLPASEREDLLERVREIAERHLGLAGGDLLSLPYRTDAYWCRRRERAALSPGLSQRLTR